ncbi:MAG: hypothetical protein HY353_00945 [Candidatus Omnitrophica bacterium]|nr:hypothetical protein [Candidatus Omnitrophota bacterium]
MFQQWVKRAPRVVAGAWFAVAGFLPVSLWFLPPIVQQRDTAAFVLIVLLPLAATGLSGSWLGAAILQRRLGGLRAFLRGAGVALGSFALLIPLYSIASVVMEPKTAGSLGEMLVQTVLALAVALLVTGWLFLPLGGVAGFLLQRIVRRGG